MSLPHIFPGKLLVNEPGLLNRITEQALTERLLMPALAELEVFFLAVRAQVDPVHCCTLRQDRIFPNHVLPELVPYCPLPAGRVRICEATQYMVAMTQAKHFQPSEKVLTAMPAELFNPVGDALQGTRLKPARHPEEGRALALRYCRQYRAERWYQSVLQTSSIVSAVHDANRRLAGMRLGGKSTSSPTQEGMMRLVADAFVPSATSPSMASPYRPPFNDRTKPMPNYSVISKAQYASKRWQRHTGYHFAAHDAVIPLVVQELPKAMMALPIAFVMTDEAFLPVAVQGLAPGKNLFVAPDSRWLGGYIPAAYRGYPFAVANTDDGQQVLCIDEASSLITDSEGEPFFNDDGTPAKALADVLNFLTQVHANREVTARICAVLQKHNLIQAWPIKVQAEAGEQNVEGLFRIDEAALNALSAEAFDEVRQAGCLPVAYCQLLSMQHLPMLGKLAQAHAQAAQPLPQTPTGELNLEFLNDSGTISFGNI
jgi:hypothetical protein